MSTIEENRLALHAILLSLVPNTVHIYFQPPESTKMQYPAIVYSRSDIDDNYANNSTYNRRLMYQITVIDSDPDSPILDKIASLPYCSFDRHFTSSNLNHDIFRIFY
jgi:hypothetical protein